MPELPEVETVARDLRGLVVGATITGARCDWPRLLRNVSPEEFAAGVAGHRIEAVGRRAKQLLIELSGRLVITVHLKMTGQLFVVPAGTPADRHVHFALEFADGRELRFRDIRKFGRVGLYPRDVITDEAMVEAGGAAVFGDIGPEPLEDAFTARRFRTILRARRGRLKPLLLDQTFIAGIGNIYADEALWRSKLHPLRSAATLRPADEGRLYRAIRAVLNEAIERRGSSIDDYTAPGGDGSMQERLQVYQRAGAPCPRCGRPIRRIVVGSRATHFCSWCQRLPTADRKGAAAILRGMTPRPGRGSGALGVPGTSPRRGPRWTELAGEGTLGLTPAEARAAAARARTERTQRAGATRRAAARRAAGAEAPEAGTSGSGADAATVGATAAGGGHTRPEPSRGESA